MGYNRKTDLIKIISPDIFFKRVWSPYCIPPAPPASGRIQAGSGQVWAGFGQVSGGFGKGLGLYNKIIGV